MLTSDLGRQKYENQIASASEVQKEANQQLHSVQNRNKALGSRIDEMKQEIALLQAQLAQQHADKTELLTNMSAVVTENIRMTKEIAKRLDKK